MNRPKTPKPHQPINPKAPQGGRVPPESGESPFERSGADLYEVGPPNVSLYDLCHPGVFMDFSCVIRVENPQRDQGVRGSRDVDNSDGGV